MPPVEMTTSSYWLSLHKRIAAVTLLVCISALGGNVAWILTLASDARHYGVEDLFLIAGIVLVMALTIALIRSTSRIAGIERERARANQDLQRSQARLRAVVKFLPVGVAVVEAPSGSLILANDQHERLLKYALTPGAPLWEQSGQRAYHADGRPYEHRDWPITRAIRTGEVVLDEEIWTERGDGSRACLSINAAPIFDDSGAISAAVMAFTDVTERKEMAEERAMLARRLINAQEDERLRVARELHDEMGQDLTALSLGLKALENVSNYNDLKRSLPGMRKIVEHMSVQVHHTASTLRPTLLGDLGLRQAVEDMVMTWAERLCISADAHLEALSDPLDDEATVTVYRVVQEALTNVAKHSQARWISVTAQHVDGQLRVVIEDDGKGFVSGSAKGKGSTCFGLSGMRERLALAGGNFAVESVPDHGTTVYASVPSGYPADCG